MGRLHLLSAIATGLLLSARAAHAVPPSGGIALNQLEPTPAGDVFFGVASPSIGGHLVPRGLVVIDHADEPLTFSSSGASGTVVGSQTFLHLDGSLALWDRLLFSLLLPIAVSQGGDSPSTQTTTFSSPSSAEVGDLRLGARVRLVGRDADAVQLGVGVYAHFPTGPSNSYVGEGAVRFSPSLLLGGRGGVIAWTIGLGMVARGSSNPASFTSGAGLGLVLLDERLNVGAEVFASTLLQEGAFQVTEKRAIPRDLLSTGAEVLLGARGRIYEGIVVGAAAGPGLTTAIGTPAFRIIGSIGWSPTSTPRIEHPVDPDEDGIAGAADACPYAFGSQSNDPKRHGCPRLDRDEDGVEDAEDACPDTWGAKNEDRKKNGCPVELPLVNGDGVPDKDGLPR
jgi:OmpA-OmpF porin, OOP family